MPSTADRLKAYGDWLVSNKNKQGSPEFEKVATEYRALRSQPMQGAETSVQPEQPAPKERPGFFGSLMESAQILGLADEAAETADMHVFADVYAAAAGREDAKVVDTHMAADADVRGVVNARRVADEDVLTQAGKAH